MSSQPASLNASGDSGSAFTSFHPLRMARRLRASYRWPLSGILSPQTAGSALCARPRPRAGGRRRDAGEGGRDLAEPERNRLARGRRVGHGLREARGRARGRTRPPGLARRSLAPEVVGFLRLGRGGLKARSSYCVAATGARTQAGSCPPPASSTGPRSSGTAGTARLSPRGLLALAAP